MAEALRADFLTTGPTVEAFEPAFAETVGARHAVACSNGTAALHLAMLALERAAGRRLVIVPSITFLATANCARYVGAEVVFADVDPDTGLMTAGTPGRGAGQAATRRPQSRAVSARCICAASRADLPASPAWPPRPAACWSRTRCHALGTTYDAASGDAARVGDGRSAMATFSFHPVKTIATGEGGMVTTNDAALAERLRTCAATAWCASRGACATTTAAFDAGRHTAPGSTRCPSPASTIACPTCSARSASASSRSSTGSSHAARAHTHLYDAALKPLAPLVRPVPPVPGCDPALHLYAC